MRKFISEYNNGRYKVGCTGGTVIVIDMETNEVIDKIKVPYCYCGTFVGDRDIFIAKSTAGYLLKYDIKAKETTRIRPSTITQDGGFTVCPWDSRFYNVEMTKKGFQMRSRLNKRSYRKPLTAFLLVYSTNLKHSRKRDEKRSQGMIGHDNKKKEGNYE